MNTTRGKPHKLPSRAVVVAAAAASIVTYLICSWAGGQIGFPLDDAWIHQTYARNLVLRGEWAFVPGQPSAGSTAPLWTLLLAAGYVLRIPYRPWAYLLGSLCLIGTALLAQILAGRLEGRVFPSAGWGRWAALAVAVEWHLVWAAVSGMETLLFALLVLALWVCLLREPARRPLLTGLLGGALVLTRPEGVLAVVLVAAGIVAAEALDGRWRRGLAAALVLALGSGLLIAPYLALNLRLSGALWPNTFYAKQAEYAVLLGQPLLRRLAQVSLQPWVGGQVLLLPGLLWAMVQAARRGGAAHLLWWLPLLWAVATVGVYALRLPVTYQHGRYLIPVIPVLVTYAVGGALALYARMRTLGRAAAVLAQVMLLATAVLLLAFLWIGARAYATDVAIIEGEMVTVARWLAANTPADALVAVHDIGAIGYFAPRPLLDLAGLVSPEVVPFIRDEERLLAWLEAQHADYLVTFPSWYPLITCDPQVELVYQTDTAVTRQQGGENMAVYALRWE